MKKKEQNVYISQGVRPIWHLIIAAACFTAVFFFVYLLFKGFNPNLIVFAIILFTYGIRFSMVVNYLFDIQNKRYKIERTIGFLKISKWKDFRNLKYISVFKKREDLFEINLWYNKNKHFTIVVYSDGKAAIEAGNIIAKKLKIDLVDASDPHNSKWIDNV